MSYLEQLKSENAYPDALPKLTKGGFDSFDSKGRRHFSEKKAHAVVDISTPTGPRTVTVSGNDHQADRFTDATIYRGEPDQAAVDLADRILDFIVARPGPVPEADIIEAVGGEPTLARNILRRLAVDGIAEALPGGLYQIPDYPPRPADLPEGCPLTTGAPFPETGCAFERRMLRRLIAERVVPLPGGRCPLRAVCHLTD